MEHIEKIRREVEYLRAELALAEDEDDGKGATRLFWSISGLERALAMAAGADPLWDDEIMALYASRKTGEGAGNNLYPTCLRFKLWKGLRRNRRGFCHVDCETEQAGRKT